MRRLLLPLLLLLAVVVIAGYWLFTTASGLQWAWARLSAAVGEPLAAASVDGTLAGPLSVRGFSLRTDVVVVTVEEARLDWTPVALLRGVLRFSSVEGSGIAVTIPPRVEPPSEEPFSGLPLPLPVEIRQADLEGIALTLPERPVQPFGRLSGGIDIGARALEFHDLSVTAADFSAALGGTLGLTADAPLALQVGWRTHWPAGESQLVGEGEIGGTLGRPNFSHRLSGPLEARLQGELQWLDQPFQWRARAEVQRADLQALADTTVPLLLVAGRLDGEGDATGLRLASSATVNTPDAGSWEIGLALEKAEEQWTLPRLIVASREVPTRAEFTAHWEQGETLTDIRNAEARLSWREVRWPLSGEPTVRSSSGTAILFGQPNHYRLNGALELAVADMPAGRLSLQGEGDRQRLALDALQLEWLEGRAAGTGSLQWLPHLQWEAELAATDVDPGAAWPGWSGRLGGTLRTQGGLEEGLALRVEVAELGGRLRGYPVEGAAVASKEGDRYAIPHLQLSSGTARFSAQGRLDEAWDFSWQLAAPDLEQVIPDASGALRATGRLSGVRSERYLQLTGRGEAIAFGALRVGQLSVEAAAGLGDQAWKAQLEAGNLRLGNLDLLHLRVTTAGRAEAHQLRAEAEGPPGELRLEASGGIRAEGWAGVLESGRFTSPTGRWEQARPAEVRVDLAGDSSLEPWCWVSASSRVCLRARHEGQAGWETRLELTALPLAAFGPLMPAEVMATGRMNGHAEVRFAEHLESLDVALQVEEGALSYPVPEGPAATTAYRRVELRADSSEGLTARASLDLAEGGSASGFVGLPGWVSGQPLAPELRLQGRLQARFDEISWISLLSPQLMAPAGWLEADLAVSGTLGDPRLVGGAALQEGSLSVAGLGIQLEGLRVEMATAPDAVASFTVSARSGPGAIRLQGQVQRQAKGPPWALSLQAQGERFEAMRLPQARVLVSPDLSARIVAGAAQVTGSLNVPEAEIRLPQLQRGVTESPDVVIVNQPAEAANGAEPRWRLTAKVQLALGDQVRVSGYGFTGRLTGHLAITDPPDGIATGQGELRIVEGQYEAYGQKLAISEGRLLFAGSPLDNPAVNFSAIRQVRDVTAGVRVTGRAQSPELELFSTPSMDESDILAYLVVGRPLTGASTEEAEVVRDAAASLGFAGGTRIAREIATEFGIEEVELQTGTNGQEAALVLGKYLSPELYVQYAVGLWETVNRLRVRYQLSEKWTFEVETGEQSGADFFYNIER